jgi:hypothetical protein
VELGPGSTALSRDGVPLLRAGLRGRFRHLSADGARLSVELPPAPADVTVDLAVTDPGAVVTLDGTRAPESRIGPLRRDSDGRDWLPVRIPHSPRPRVLEILHPQSP